VCDDNGFFRPAKPERSVQLQRALTEDWRLIIYYWVTQGAADSDPPNAHEKNQPKKRIGTTDERG
jgi:hypothetical protein